jgi:hypothetical protein
MPSKMLSSTFAILQQVIRSPLIPIASKFPFSVFELTKLTTGFDRPVAALTTKEFIPADHKNQ